MIETENILMQSMFPWHRPAQPSAWPLPRRTTQCSEPKSVLPSSLLPRRKREPSSRAWKGYPPTIKWLRGWNLTIGKTLFLCATSYPVYCLVIHHQPTAASGEILLTGGCHPRSAMFLGRGVWVLDWCSVLVCNSPSAFGSMPCISMFTKESTSKTP